jgi:hypothetical protein
MAWCLAYRHHPPGRGKHRPTGRRAERWWWLHPGLAADDDMPPQVSAALLAAVAAALVAWYFAGATVAIVVAVAGECAGRAVTVPKLRRHPDSGPLASWWWYGVAAACAVAAVGHSGGIFYASPTAGVVIAAAVIVTAWRGGHRPALPGWVFPLSALARRWRLWRRPVTWPGIRSVVLRQGRRHRKQRWAVAYAHGRGGV